MRRTAKITLLGKNHRQFALAVALLLGSPLLPRAEARARAGVR